MREPKLRRVQRLSVKPKLLQYLAVRLSGAAVDRVAKESMSDRSHVHPDLMGAPGLEPAFDQGCVFQQLEPFPVSHRALAPVSLDDGDLLPIRGRARKRSVDGAAGGFRQTADDREIAAVD